MAAHAAVARRTHPAPRRSVSVGSVPPAHHHHYQNGTKRQVVQQNGVASHKPPQPLHHPPHPVAASEISTTAIAATAALKPESPNSNLLSHGSDRTVKKLRLTRALTVPEGVSVAEACRRMAHRRVGAVMLSDETRALSGIVTDRDIAIRVIAEGLKPELTPVSAIMTPNPVSVTFDTLAIDALQDMVQGNFRHLPVVENGEAVALLDIAKCMYDAICRLEKAAEQGSAIAAAVEGVERQWGNDFSGHYVFIESLRERMFKPSLSTIISENINVAVVSPADSVYSATKKMSELQVSSVIAMRGGKPQGILTSKDVLLRVVARNLSPELIAVEQVMTANPECAALDTTILDALQIMHDGRFLHLPILDHDGLIVACLDVLQITRAALSMVDDGSGTADDVARTMIQRFWESALALEPLEEGYEAYNEPCALVECVGTRKRSHATFAAHFFTFKIEDKEGRMHKFKSGTRSLHELLAAVRERVMHGNYRYNALLEYVDADGDKIILETDSDLAEAVDYAKSVGWKVIRLYLDSSDTDKETNRLTVSHNKLNQKTDWGFLQTGILTGALLVAGLSIVVLLKRSKPYELAT